MTSNKKSFGLWNAIFLGIGSMVGAGIFIVIGQAGAIAGNFVIASFLIAGIIALLCGYSLCKLSVTYPSRGGIIEYLVQAYGKGLFSGSLGILFYFAQLISIAAVAKSFGTYASTYLKSGINDFNINMFALIVLGVFVIINLLGAAFISKIESSIVIIKLIALIIFTFAAILYIEPSHFSFKNSPSSLTILYSLGLTFFAFQGFSVITNSVEDMDNPSDTMLKSMVITIILVAILYISVSIAVFGNLSLEQIIKSEDFALAKAAQPIFGILGFKLIAATALLATASAINATLYAATQIGYTLAKEGDLPNVYQRHIYHNTEGLIISALIVVPMILFLDLGTIASIAAIIVLLIQGLTHIGHLFVIKETKANIFIIILSILGTFLAAGFAIYYTSKEINYFFIYILITFIIAFIIEILLRKLNKREIKEQC